ncbi:sensor histidine kinase [Sphingosinicella terrae]|uniref:sensor histidine kinase n=1 Tax=Sphingosinicella terrae TaxID=2172047 RepID=UPI000E0DE696|nr:GAF domain-containing sensor histidine kinase [Sphingosinicella terrae]
MPDERRARLLELLARVGEELLSPMDPQIMAGRIFDILRDELDLDAFFNYEAAGVGRLRLVAHHGISPEQAEEAADLAFGQAVCGMVAEERKPIYRIGIQASDEPCLSFVKAVGLECYACTPLVVNDELLGTLGFGRRSAPCFAEDELSFLRTACHYVALAKHRARERVRELEDMRRQRDLLREKAALRARLSEMNQLDGMTAIVATLAHELNQPLTAAANFLSATPLLIPRDTAKAVEACEAARRQVLRAGGIVRRISDQIKGRNDHHAVAVAAMFEEALAIAEAAGISAGIAVETRVDPGAEQVKGDRIQIVQVLGNFIRNACQAMERVAQPRLILSARRHGIDRVRIAVSDFGEGLDAETIGDLFDPIRISDSGLGLGLVICRAIVDAHGGDIWAEARAEGGADFCFTLPSA